MGALFVQLIESHSNWLSHNLPALLSFLLSLQEALDHIVFLSANCVVIDVLVHFLSYSSV